MHTVSNTHALAAALALLCSAASAATIPVAASDSPALIAAMSTAASNPDPTNTIDLAGGTYVLTAVDHVLDGPNGLPTVTGGKSLTINGNGSTIERSTAPGTPEFRILHVDGVGNSTLILNDLTISNGFVPVGFAGGGIRHTDTAMPTPTVLTMTGCTVTGCSAGNQGGGISMHRCVATLTDCTLSGNTAGTAGGGIASHLFGTLTMTDCTVTGNVVTDAMGTGGGIHRNSNGFGVETETYLTRCTIDGNMVQGAGGRGGGLFHECFVSTSTRIIEIELCTISGNSSAGDGGGICNFARNACCSGTSAVARMNIKNSTITLNTAAGAGGGFTSADSGGVTRSEISLLNTILAGNSAAAGGADGNHASVVLTSLGHNLIGDNSTMAAAFPAGLPNPAQDLVGTSAAPVDALLEPLGANGGPTSTHALGGLSPARDTGDPTQGPTDQRGMPRPLGAGVDIGSFEAIPAPVCTLLGPVIPATGDVVLTLDASSISSPTVDASFEASTDGGATYFPCTTGPLSPLANPALAVPPGAADYHWDSVADGVGLAVIASGVLVRALVVDGVALAAGECATTPFDVDNTAPTCRLTCGDCNLNGIGPDIIDALAAAQISAGLVTPSPDQMTCCDTNSSLNVEILDALQMAQAAAGIAVSISCP